VSDTPTTPTRCVGAELPSAPRLRREDLEATGYTLSARFETPVTREEALDAIAAVGPGDRSSHTLVTDGEGFNVVALQHHQEPACLTIHNMLGWHHVLGESRASCIATLRHQLALDVNGRRLGRDLSVRISAVPEYQVRLSLAGERPQLTLFDHRPADCSRIILMAGTRLELIEHFLTAILEDGDHWRPHTE
jgi:hypothetical protein